MTAVILDASTVQRPAAGRKHHGHAQGGVGDAITIPKWLIPKGGLHTLGPRGALLKRATSASKGVEG